MNCLPSTKQQAVLKLILEGCSIRSVERLTGIHRDTIMRLVVRTGKHCAKLMGDHIRSFQPLGAGSR